MDTRRRIGYRRLLTALSRLQIHLSLVLLVFLGLSASLALSAISSLSGEIVEVNDQFGNLNTDIPAAQLTLKVGQPFVFQCRDRDFEATFAAWYSDVPEGEWLGLINETNHLQLAVNFGDANEVSGCRLGDSVTVTLN
jgi:S-adenosylmethionine hydrolase